MIALEDDLGAFVDREVVESMARDASTPAEYSSYPVSAPAVARALELSQATDAMAQLHVDLGAAKKRAFARVAGGALAAQEFLSRPYYESARNRYLFCEANEKSSFSNNRSTGWDDSFALAQLGRRGEASSSGHGPDAGSSGGEPCHRRDSPKAAATAAAAGKSPCTS